MIPISWPVSGRGGPLEARLAGVVVAALKEAFDRDHQRLELEREQIEAERARAERVLRIELARQAGDQEIGRLRLLAGVAIASWLGTLFFSVRLVGGASGGRVALGVGWLLLLAALAASFVAQSTVTRGLNRTDAREFASSGTRRRARALAPRVGSGGHRTWCAASPDARQKVSILKSEVSRGADDSPAES